MPIALPNRAISQVNAIGAGRLLKYSDATVEATSLTAPSDITRPRTIPATPPSRPKQLASPKIPVKITPRGVPKARRMPISKRRRTTDTEMVL